MSDNDVMKTGGKVIDLMEALKTSLGLTCKPCSGRGRTPVGLTAWRPCDSCDGTGKPPAVVSGRSNE